MAAAVVSGLAMVIVVVGWRQAGADADQSEGDAVAAEERAAEMSERIRTAEETTAEAVSQVEVLEGLVAPGMAAELQGAYLRLAASACVDPDTPPDRVIDQVVADVAADSEALSAKPGWETAIPAGVVGEARSHCGGSDD